MTTIDFPFYTMDGVDRFMPAEIVDVAPHLIATWVVHRDQGRHELWVVSNVETGYRVGKSVASSRAAALRKARSFLADITQAIYDRQARKCERVGFCMPVTSPTQSEMKCHEE